MLKVGTALLSLVVNSMQLVQHTRNHVHQTFVCRCGMTLRVVLAEHCLVGSVLADSADLLTDVSMMDSIIYVSMQSLYCTW